MKYVHKCIEMNGNESILLIELSQVIHSWFVTIITALYPILCKTFLFHFGKSCQNLYQLIREMANKDVYIVSGEERYTVYFSLPLILTPTHALLVMKSICVCHVRSLERYMPRFICDSISEIIISFMYN